MNNRIKHLRKAVNATMESFGAKIGLSKSAVSLMESGKSQPTEQTIKSICREFGVSEAWLRDGVGEMFEQADAVSLLDQLEQQYNINYIERAALEAYLSAPPAVRTALSAYLSDLTARIQQTEDTMQQSAGTVQPASPAVGGKTG